MRYLNLILILFIWSLSVFAQAPKLPPLDNQVVDEAGLISSQDKEVLSQKIYELHAQGGPQMAIYITNDLQGYPIEDFSIRVAEHWQLGTKSKGNGLLVIIAPTERKMRIEVGQGIEGEITDYDSSKWVRHILSPAFKQGQYAQGLDELITRVAEKFGIQLKGEGKVRRVRRGSGNLNPLFVLFLIIIGIVIRTMGGGGGPRGFGGGRYYGGGFGGGGLGGGGGGFGGGGWGGGGGGFSGGGSSGSW